MKKLNITFLSVFMFLILLAGQSIYAAPSAIRTFGGKFIENNQIELMYAAKSGKLGVIIKSEKGEPIAAHILQNVSGPIGTFDLSGARKFGNTEAFPLTNITVTKYKDNGAVITINGNSYKLKSITEPMANEELKCDNYCRPSDPGQFNWWLCYWCCATASGPCV